MNGQEECYREYLSTNNLSEGNANVSLEGKYATIRMSIASLLSEMQLMDALFDHLLHKRMKSRQCMRDVQQEYTCLW